MNRRFVNLVMHDLRSSICSLYRMDIRHLFYETAEIAVQMQGAEDASKAENKMNKLSMVEESWKDLHKPAVNFKASNFVTLLLRENSIMVGDSSGRTALLDPDFKSVVTTPPMRNGKGPNCVSFSMPNPDPLRPSNSQCLYVLDLVPAGNSANSSTFEYLIWHLDSQVIFFDNSTRQVIFLDKKSTFEYLTYLGNNDSSRPLVSVPSHYNLDWVWRDLPMPPFADDPANSRAAMNCSSMLLDCQTMRISSSEEGMGTYTFDMVSHEWSRAGNWALPFCGKAQYVPKLKLWFALSPPSSPHGLCALDLPANAMDFESPPELLRTWDYLHPLDETPYKSHLVNLGSGKFCVVSLFKTFSSKYVQENVEDETAVLTGLEVCRCNNNEGAVRMIKHMSKRHTFGKLGIHCVL